MKLSKAQQEVVDKMHSALHIKLSPSRRAFIISPGSKDRLHLNTFNALVLSRVIERREGSELGGWIYRLTKQYKNEQK